MPPTHIWTAHPIESWGHFKEAWDALNDRLSASPLLCSRFVSACLAYFGTGSEQIAVCRANDGHIVAAAIGRSLGLGRWSVLQIAQAPLGFWLCEPAAPVERLIQDLARSLGPSVLVLSVPQLDPALNPAPANTATLRVDPYIRTARVVIDLDWPDYWNSRSKNLRSNHRKARKRADESGLALEVRRSSTSEAVAAAVGVYASLEARSWKSAGGTAVTPTNRQGEFYTALLSDMAGVGQARAYTLVAGEEPAAVDLCVTGGDCLVILKTTYSEKFKELSPASLLREMYMAEIFREPRIRRIEYYGRVMDWHLKWTSDTRTIYHATAYRNPLLKRAHDLLRRTALPGTSSESR